MRLFCLQLEASCLQWSFLLTIDSFSFFTYNWSFFAYSFSFFTYSWSFFAYSGKVCLIRALRDSKQRSLTVSKKALTESKKATLHSLFSVHGQRLYWFPLHSWAFPQQESSFCPSTYSLGNQGRMLHSFTPFTRIYSLHSHEKWPLAKLLPS